MTAKRVLIVEDQFFLAEMIRTRLEHLGYDVTYAENGQKALDLLEKSPVDLVIMDVMMPVMDGMEATRRIRSQPKWNKLPVICLTARARPEDRAEVMSSGVSDYLAKPFESGQLVAMIEKWLK